MRNKKPITARSDEELNAEVEKHARNERLSAWLIVAALVFEAGVLWTYRRNTVEAILFLLSDLGIAAGVYGEIFSDRKSKIANDELQRRSNERVAEANRRADEANLELVRFRAPRVLSPEQIDRVAGKLRPHKGVECEFGVQAALPELLGFVGSIESAVEAAGWTECSCSSSPSLDREGKHSLCIGADESGGVVVGMLAAAFTSETSMLSRAGRALASALKAEGFEAEAKGVGGPFRVPAADSRLHIMIGPKS